MREQMWCCALVLKSAILYLCYFVSAMKGISIQCHSKRSHLCGGVLIHAVSVIDHMHSVDEKVKQRKQDEAKKVTNYLMMHNQLVDMSIWQYCLFRLSVPAAIGRACE